MYGVCHCSLFRDPFLLTYRRVSIESALPEEIGRILSRVPPGPSVRSLAAYFPSHQQASGAGILMALDLPARSSGVMPKSAASRVMT